MSAIETGVFAEAAARIASWKRPLLISHTRPDGDALGSLMAMRSLLQRQGVVATALLFEPLPDRYAMFERHGPVAVLGADLAETDLAGFDGVVVLDTCAYAQLRPIADWLRETGLPKLAIDHHVTRDELADLYVIDESAAAACLIVYDWAQALGWSIDREVGESLFVGIAMDTGWFRYSNVDGRVFAASADLVSLGVRPHDLFQELFYRESPGRVRLLGAALGALELLADDRLAVMTLPSAAFRLSGAARADTEDIVNEPLRIGTVVVSALLVDHGDGLIRASLRSKSPREAADPDVDIAAIAQALGGGGHQRAAAARVTGTLDDVRGEIVKYVTAALAGTSPPRV